MIQIIPSITRSNIDVSHLAGPANPAEPLSVAGPAWIEPTLLTVTGQAPWPALSYAGTSEGGSGADTEVYSIRVSGPERADGVPRTLPDSSYTMRIGDAAIDIECAEPSGLVQALRTLGQVRTGDGQFPCGTIEDKPRFAWRGIHLDVGRHFFGPDFVKRLLRLMASLGYNVFHWHLTEDQGWRIPIPAYPRLTEIGAYRTQKDGTRYGGHYTADEIRDVVRFAGTLGLLVVPEIELPGHATAAISAYPELSCRGVEVPVDNGWGIHEEVFCAGNDTLFEFVGTVFDEVCRLFPSEIVHLGGDECPRTRWKECDKCAARIESEGLADYDELQSYVIGRAARMLADRGRHAIGWDEILEGGLPAGTLVMSWRGTAGGIEAASSGHKVVMSPTSHCYLDYRQTDAPDETGFPYADEHGQVPVISIEKMYEFDPLNGLPPDARENVLGGQGNVWTEEMPTEEIVERMIAPRILAMAEVLWAYPEKRDFEEFRTRAKGALGLFDHIGWSYTTVPELK